MQVTRRRKFGSYSTRNQDEQYEITYRDLNSARALTGLRDRNSTGRGIESSLDAALGFKQWFARKGHVLSAEVSGARDAEGGPSSVRSRSFALTGAQAGATALETQESWEHPTAHYADPLNLSRGNPYLKPEYIRALELGLQRTGERVTAQLTPFWRHTIDAVRSIRTIDAAGVSTRTYANIASADAYGADATVALGGGRLTGFVGASAYHQVSNAANVTPGLSINAFGWRGRANATMRFSKTLDVQALLSYQPAMTVEQGRTDSRMQFSFAGRKKLIDDQLSVTLRVIDPFNTSREGSTTIDPRFSQVSTRARRIRGLLLGLSYTFGKPDKDKEADLLNGIPGGG